MDTDARRSRAVNRLAKYSDRAGRWPGPLGRFAQRRRDAAERHVERRAAVDLMVARWNPGYLARADAAIRPDGAADSWHFAAAVEHYRACCARLAGYLDDHAAPEGVRPAPEPAAEVRRGDRRRRWW